MATKKKILVFENDPETFEETALGKYLIKHNYTWDFACSLKWELSHLLKCGIDLIMGKYDTIATETFFGYSKRDAMHKDDESDGGQLREMVMLLEAVLAMRKKPLTVLFSQKMVDVDITPAYLKKHLLNDSRFVRYSSTTRGVLEHKRFKLVLLNLITK